MPLLKGPMIRIHKRDDLKGDQVGEGPFDEFQITEQEYNTLKQPLLNAPQSSAPKTVPPNSGPKTFPLNPTPKKPADILANNPTANPLGGRPAQYSGEPIATFRQVLLVSGGNAGI